MARVLVLLEEGTGIDAYIGARLAELGRPVLAISRSKQQLDAERAALNQLRTLLGNVTAHLQTLSAGRYEQTDAERELLMGRVDKSREQLLSLASATPLSTLFVSKEVVGKIGKFCSLQNKSGHANKAVPSTATRDDKQQASDQQRGRTPTSALMTPAAPVTPASGNLAARLQAVQMASVPAETITVRKARLSDPNERATHVSPTRDSVVPPMFNAGATPPQNGTHTSPHRRYARDPSPGGGDSSLCNVVSGGAAATATDPAHLESTACSASSEQSEPQTASKTAAPGPAPTSPAAIAPVTATDRVPASISRVSSSGSSGLDRSSAAPALAPAPPPAPDRIAALLARVGSGGSSGSSFMDRSSGPRVPRLQLPTVAAADAAPSLMSPMLVGSPSLAAIAAQGDDPGSVFAITRRAALPFTPLSQTGVLGRTGSGSDGGAQIPTPGAAGNTPPHTANGLSLAAHSLARTASSSSVVQEATLSAVLSQEEARTSTAATAAPCPFPADDTQPQQAQPQTPQGDPQHPAEQPQEGSGGIPAPLPVAPPHPLTTLAAPRSEKGAGEWEAESAGQNEGEEQDHLEPSAAVAHPHSGAVRGLTAAQLAGAGLIGVPHRFLMPSQLLHPSHDSGPLPALSPAMAPGMPRPGRHPGGALPAQGGPWGSWSGAGKGSAQWGPEEVEDRLSVVSAGFASEENEEMVRAARSGAGTRARAAYVRMKRRQGVWSWVVRVVGVVTSVATIAVATGMAVCAAAAVNTGLDELEHGPDQISGGTRRAGGNKRKGRAQGRPAAPFFPAVQHPSLLAAGRG